MDISKKLTLFAANECLDLIQKSIEKLIENDDLQKSIINKCKEKDILEKFKKEMSEEIEKNIQIYFMLIKIITYEKNFFHL